MLSLYISNTFEFKGPLLIHNSVCKWGEPENKVNATCTLYTSCSIDCSDSALSISAQSLKLHVHVHVQYTCRNMSYALYDWLINIYRTKSCFSAQGVAIISHVLASVA